MTEQRKRQRHTVGERKASHSQTHKTMKAIEEQTVDIIVPERSARWHGPYESVQWEFVLERECGEGKLYPDVMPYKCMAEQHSTHL